MISETQKIILTLKRMGFLNEQKIKAFMKKRKQQLKEAPEKEFNIWLSSVVVDDDEDGEGDYLEYKAEAELEKYEKVFKKNGFNVTNSYVEQLDEETDFDMW